MEKAKHDALMEQIPVLKDVRAAQETVWINPHRSDSDNGEAAAGLTMADIDDAEARLARFAPFIMRCFPETAERGGLIESDLVPVPQMQARLNEKYESALCGKLLLKKDSHLAIAGSIKARGGIYEVLKHAEDLAIAHGILTPGDDYAKLADEKDFYSRYTVQVGSTGNLGMSIGIMSAAIGFEVIVHMSADAKQWKKDLLRSRGAKVIEYASDYSAAVSNGRRLSDENPNSYFVDDENSKNLFLGYAVAAKRLKKQLDAQNITVDDAHPLFVYIPCGVGGAPGGVCFGLRQVFGSNVYCFFVEPTQAPCMLLGMATGLHSGISVQDAGLHGMTEADGLAVGRPSGFVGKVMEPILCGVFTIDDARLFEYLRDLMETEEIFLEPSACAAFRGPAMLNKAAETVSFIDSLNLAEKMPDATHIAWATGGSLVPESIRSEYLRKYK